MRGEAEAEVRERARGIMVLAGDARRHPPAPACPLVQVESISMITSVQTHADIVVSHEMGWHFYGLL